MDSSDSTNVELLFRQWLDLLGEAFRYAKAAHIHRMLLTHVDRYDSRGIDIYSEIWGQISYVQALLPREVNELGVVTPAGLRAEAKVAALHELDDRLQESSFLELVSQARNTVRNGKR